MTSMMKRIKVIFMVNEQSSQEGNKESNFNITQQRQNTKSQYIAIISTTPKQRQICYHGHFLLLMVSTMMMLFAYLYVHVSYFIVYEKELNRWEKMKINMYDITFNAVKLLKTSFISIMLKLIKFKRISKS